MKEQILFKILLYIGILLSISCSQDQSAEKINNLQTDEHIVDVLNDLNSEQLIVVLTKDSVDFIGYLYRYEWLDNNWVLVDGEIDITIGKNGMANGVGEKVEYMPKMNEKIEGDGKTPSGIFTIGNAFGFSDKENVKEVNLNYLQIDSLTRCIEDFNSIYYNEIIQLDQVEKDWESADKMRNVLLYEWGFFLNHNTPAASNKGSCVFFHIWRAPGKYTLGCTAMSKENIIKLLKWIDPDKNPLVIQYVISDYIHLSQKMNLPAIILP